MASLETFDKEVKELVQSGKLSASKVKSVTEAAMANITNDAHLVATLFKAHKQAKSSHKLSSLYIVDAIAREARSQVKRGKDKGKAAASTPQDSQTPSMNDDVDSDNDSVSRKRKASGTYTSFLAKIESFIDRLVAEVLTKGPPEHKEKVKKLLDIWTKTVTFSPESLKSSYAKLGSTNNSANASPGPSESSSKRKEKRGQAKRTAIGNSSIRSTTPPYPPPEPPIQFPPVPTTRNATSANAGTYAFAALPLATQPTPVIDPSQAAQLASLLALQQTAQSPFPVPGPSSQPAPAPAFEANQLALLQQLAAAQGPAAPTLPAATANNPFAALLPLVGSAGSPPSQAPPLPFAQPDAYNQSYSFDRRPANHRSSRDRREEDSRGNDRRDRRSASPPARRRESYQDNSNRPSAAEVAEQYARRREMQKNAPQEQLQKIPTMVSSQPEPERPRQMPRPMPNQTQQIASFVSDDTEDSRGGRFVGKRDREAKARQDISEFDLDHFAVAVGASQTSQSGGQQQMQEDTYEESYNSVQNGENNNGNSGEAVSIQNAQPFDGTSFNALDADSWASFAKMCQQNMGYLPSNQEMLAWVMNGMQMMQQAAIQQMGQQGMQQGQHQRIFSQQHDEYSHQRNSQHNMDALEEQGAHDESAYNTSARDGAEGRGASASGVNQQQDGDSGDGEADMDMTPDPED